MIARLKPQGKEWAVQLGYNPVNLVCQEKRQLETRTLWDKLLGLLYPASPRATITIKGHYEIRTWATQQAAKQWISHRGFTVERTSGEHV